MDAWDIIIFDSAYITHLSETYQMFLYLVLEDALTLVQVRYIITSSFVVIQLELEILLEQKNFFSYIC